jgi:hypothetical protein
VHGSIWRFHGPPHELTGRYDALVAQIASASLRLHACLRRPNGLLVFDTCPSLDAFEASEPMLRSAMAAVGLPEPTVEHHPVHAAFAHGAPLAE